jgi:hypothetical protein
MKNIFLLLLLFTGMVKAQIVNIPDANFKAALVNAGNAPENQVAYKADGTFVSIDTNADGEIQVSEAAEIDGGLKLNALSIGFGITNLSGLEAFTNISEFNCSNNFIGNLNTGLLPVSLKSLVCAQSGLTTLDVSSLPNLVTLDCNENAITTLNVSNMLFLRELFCHINALSSLNVSGSTALIKISCGENQLTALNLSGLINLKILWCHTNQLTSLDITVLDALEEFYCYDNAITSINFGSISNLKRFACSDNQISSLDVSQFINMEEFGCGQNNLTSLDVSQNTNLRFLSFGSNNITSIDVSMLNKLRSLDCSFTLLTTLDAGALVNIESISCMGTFIETLYIKNGTQENIDYTLTSNLIYVCADENEVESVQYYLELVGEESVVVNSYCDFTPGGNYNTISGTTTFDYDNDGCDTLDLHVSHVRLNINDGTNQGATFTNNIGNYTFFTEAGSFGISASMENPAWFNFSPSAVTIPFGDDNNNTVIQDFCITANGLHPDLEIVVAPIASAMPGFDALYQIVYKNKGNHTLSGNITFTYDDAHLDFVNATMTPDTQSIGLLNWNYTDLLPFENRSLYVTLNVNMPSDTPAVNIGDVLHFEATITPVIGDEIPADNLSVYNETVVGSYDPNNITCIEGPVVPPSEIGNYLHYIINFENTGTFPAENIVVKTEVDASKFDIGSLQLMNTNFPVDARISGNKVEFIFKNIQLPIGGHGHILLKIKTNATLVVGDAVANRADIFFDYNFPIDTGLANTVFQTLSNTDFEIDDSVLVAPNPASSEVIVKADNVIKSMQLYDAQGRIITTNLTNTLESKLDVSSYGNGIYFIKIITEKGIKVQKLQKD